MNWILSAFANGLCLGALVAFSVWALMSIIPKNGLNAVTRYAVWWVTLAVVIAAPLAYLPLAWQQVERPAPWLP